MKIKVSETTPLQLDWLVGYIQTYAATNGKPVLTGDLMQKALQNGMASPSTDWSQGGPIIEREGMWLRHFTADDPDMARWEAINGWFPANVVCTGPTPLIAAMRCYVASKLGDEVEVSDELGTT